MTKLVTSIALLLTFTSIALAQQADDLIRKYRLPNQLDVEIYKNGDQFDGKIIGLGSLDAEHQLDIKNPDEALRNDPLMGKVIIKNLRYDKSEKQWLDGSMYGPEKGLIFNLEVTEIRKNEIEVVGSKFFFWKTLVWQKL